MTRMLRASAWLQELRARAASGTAAATTGGEATGTAMVVLALALWMLPSPYATAGVEVTVRPARFGAVFDPAEPARFTATVRNTGAAAEAELRWRVERWSGGVLYEVEPVGLSVPPGESRAAELVGPAPGPLPQGECLRLVVGLWAGGEKQQEWRKGFGFLPARTPTGPPEDSPFGLLGEHGWPLMQRLGVRYVRPNWSWAERPLEWAQRYGIATCPLINEANAAATGRMSLDEYARFVGESVRRYQGYIRYWQLGNEFDVFHHDGPPRYVEAQRVGYEAAKAADPDCVVVAGSITELQCRREGFREALDLGLAHYCDLYDFHFYQSPATTDELLTYIHETLAATDAVKPIWVTETTQVGMFDPDDDNQAAYVCRRYAHLLSRGISVVMWHALTWPYPLSQDPVAATALVDHDGFARPGLFAYAALTRELEGTRFAQSWPVGEGRQALEFAGPEKHVLIVWTEGEPGEITVRAPATECVTTDPTGHREVVPTREGALRLPLTSPPLLVTLGAAPVAVEG